MNPFRLATRLQPPHRARVLRGGVQTQAPDPGPLREPDPGPGRVSRGSSAAVPVPVPWRVTLRSASGVIEVAYNGPHPVSHVRFALAGEGMLGLSLPRTVRPGERVRVTLRGRHSEAAAEAPDAMLVLRWFEPNGVELLWPIAL